VEVVGRTEAELDALVGRITGDIGKLAAEGIAVTGVGVDVQANAVEVGIERPTRDQVNAIKNLYGDAIYVAALPHGSPGSCLGRNQCWDPAKGGLWVKNVDTSESCSSGFVARDSRRNIYLFTAGHCASGNYSHHDMAIGHSTYSSWYQSSSADARIIDIADLEVSNEYFKSTTNFMHVTARVGSTGDYVGEAICIQSYMYNVNCGTITNTNWSLVYEDIGFVRQRRANFWAHPGDSGGGVYLSSNPWAEGLYTFDYTPDNNSVFSQIALAEVGQNSPYSVTICTTMTC
jgi:hypothetical protein